MTRSTLIVLLGLAALIGCGEFEPAAPGTQAPDPFRTGLESYIVTLAPGGRPVDVARGHGLEPDHIYEYALNGFSARIPRQAIEGLLRTPDVQTIEADGMVTGEGYIQDNATWGLDRIDQRAYPLDNAYRYTHTGQGVTAYIIDTGIRFDHNDFEGRAVRGFDAIGDGQDGDDCRGHGTHVAGIVGGKEWGVAKKVKLVSVRVLNCNGVGSVSGVVAGIDWVAGNNKGPAVANLSLGMATTSQTMNTATRNMVAAGVQAAIAAGNSDADACTFSPASTREAVTVGNAGTGVSDVRQPASNWGDCVDLFAPGAAIRSASHLDNTSSVLRGGTSMAAPHAAGVMALWLEEDPTLTPSQLQEMIVSHATQDVVTDAKSENAHMLFSLRDGATPPPPPSAAPPTASFAADCEETDCSFIDQSSPDGSIVKWAWDFGDGSTSSERNPSRRYEKAGAYTVVQTVTDEAGLTDTAARTILVTEPETDGIQLSATGTQAKGVRRVTLSWSGAASTTVDVFRNGSVATMPNTGSYVDEFKGGGGSFTYSICDAGTIRCSPEVTVKF
jgi:subtilisin family serine protease